MSEGEYKFLSLEDKKKYILKIESKHLQEQLKQKNKLNEKLEQEIKEARDRLRESEKVKFKFIKMIYN